MNWSQVSSDDLGAIESEADMLFQQGNHRDSVDLLLQYEGLLTSTSYLSFCIGRNFLYLSDLSEAKGWLQNSINLHPVFPWAFYELGRLDAGLNDLTGAAGWFCKFLECRDTVSYHASLNSEHRETILTIAHGCFNVNRSGALHLYRLLDEHGAPDYLVQLRCAEDLLDQGQGKLAEQKIQRIQERQPLDIWGLFALSKARHLQNDRDGALQVLLDTLDSTSKNDELMALACHRLIEINCLAEALNVFSQHCGNRSVDQLTPAFLGLCFRLAVSTRDHDKLKVLIDQNAAAPRIERWLVVEAVFKLTLSGDQITDADIHITSRLVAVLEANPLSDLGTVLALFHFYARRRAWDRTDRLNQLLAGTHFEDNPEVKLRQFDYLCLRARLSEAGDFVARHYANQDLGQWEACSVMRYYAEAKRWPDAAATLIKFIGRGFYFPTGEFFLLQICRKTGIHKQIINLLDAVPQLNETESKNLRQFLVDDLCIRDGVSALLGAAGDTAPTKDRCAHENEILIKPILQPEQSEHCDAAPIFFTCTDKAYFLSVATLLVSYRANNPVSSERWIVFVDRNVPTSWTDGLEALASSLGTALKIVREEAFVTTEIAHQDTYGIFTGGNTLSRAAFFRIYAAKYLLNNTDAARAIYLDSDIVCRDDLSDFRQLSFAGQLLLARAEEFSPEIRDASVKNSLDPSRYFNSGVLQFNLSGVGMRLLIDEAIRLAECEPEKLVFHDQCALNIAFFGRTIMLDARFNYFLRPARPENGDYSGAALLHYLDKPKPWDVTYKREYRSIWSSYAFAVRALLPADIFREIVSAANGHPSC
jgi:lipopolysaccharide biosynthesis glycosyltransferase